MSLPITQSSEIKSIFPYVTDKAIIDFVNGLSTAKELNTVQQHRLSLQQRIFDNLSGKSAIRQTNINDHILSGLETCRGLFQELSKDIEHHGVALLTLESSIQNLEKHLIKTINFAADFKDEFNAFALETQKGLDEIKHELNMQKRLTLAEQQMTRLMDKWAAGGLNQLSPIGRCYAVLDALYWGAFGNLVRLNNTQTAEFLDNLQDKLIIRLQEDLGIERDQDLMRDEWLKLPENADQSLQDLLAYQGDWCLSQAQNYPTTFVATQWQTLPQPIRMENQNIPFVLMDIERVSKRLIQDRFEV